MNALYMAHSGLRYLVLLAGLAAVVMLTLGAVARRPSAAARVLATAFVGLLDLQILLGIGLVVAGIFYGALMGHLVLMIAAAVVAHVTSVMARRASDEHKANTTRLVGVAIALACIVGGIAAIGRSVFGTAAATPIG